MIPEGGQHGGIIPDQFISADLHSVLFDHLLYHLSLLLPFRNTTNKKQQGLKRRVFRDTLYD